MTNDDKTRQRRMGVWIKHAEDLPEDAFHLQFICYWIAFDAAFAQFAKGGGSGIGRMLGFLKDVVRTDKNQRIYTILRDRMQNIERISVLRQTSPSFWDRKKSEVQDPSKWAEHFVDIRVKEKDRFSLMLSIQSDDHVFNVLEDLFRRLYVVRNQIFHGGSSGAGSHGKTQVKEGALLLSQLIPCFREIMRKSADWGPVPFPRLGNPDQQSDMPPPWPKGK